MNPSTAFGLAFCDELARCGLREVVLAPGSRSTPLAMAFGDLEQRGRLRLHVRIDERSASFTALGLAKASRRPVAVLCTSGTAAANFHPAVIEADESGVPLLVLTADRPPELRSTGANQAIDQIKLYGSAVRWFCEAGVPERRAGAVAYWRSLACQAWAHAAGRAGGFAGPVHLNLAFRDPLTPDRPGEAGDQDWPEALDGRPAGRRGPASSRRRHRPGQLELPWTERGVVVCGDGDYDAAALVGAGRAGRLAGARRAVVRGQARAERAARLPVPARHAGIHGRAPARRAGVGRAAGSVPPPVGPAGRSGRPARGHRAGAGPLGGPAAGRHRRRRGHPAQPARPPGRRPGWTRGSGPIPRRATRWTPSWTQQDRLTEPRLARDLVLGMPEDALLWTASSMPVRDIDFHAVTRADIRVLANRGTSGIDGTVSAAIGAALAHAGPAFALIGDLAFLHDAPGLALGPSEPRPDLCLVVVNNDGGGIFSTLEQAAFTGSFERLFGTPHGAGLDHLAAAFGLPYQRLDQPEDLGKALAGTGLRIVEAQTGRADGAALRRRLREAAAAAIRSAR